jgi:hypothetical protein
MKSSFISLQLVSLCSLMFACTDEPLTVDANEPWEAWRPVSLLRPIMTFERCAIASFAQTKAVPKTRSARRP